MSGTFQPYPHDDIVHFTTRLPTLSFVPFDIVVSPTYTEPPNENATTATPPTNVAAEPPALEGEAIPLVVRNFSPPPGVRLQWRQPVSFDVIGDPHAAWAFVWLNIEATGVCELVYNGQTFTPQYASGSRRHAIKDGYRYEIQRATGWPRPPSSQASGSHAVKVDVRAASHQEPKTE